VGRLDEHHLHRRDLKDLERRLSGRAARIARRRSDMERVGSGLRSLSDSASLFPTAVRSKMRSILPPALVVGVVGHGGARETRLRPWRFDRASRAGRLQPLGVHAKPPESPSLRTQWVTAMPVPVQPATVPPAQKSTSSGWATTTAPAQPLCQQEPRSLPSDGVTAATWPKEPQRYCRLPGARLTASREEGTRGGSGERQVQRQLVGAGSRPP
jgi:hypothetical protein